MLSTNQQFAGLALLHPLHQHDHHPCLPRYTLQFRSIHVLSYQIFPCNWVFNYQLSLLKSKAFLLDTIKL